MSNPIAVTAGLWASVWMGQAFCAWSWDPLADEALYWEWGRHLSWGYLDQPPAIAAWARALSPPGAPWMGRLRIFPLACAWVMAAAVWQASGRRPSSVLWLAACPPLVLLTTFFSPDAGLLACWAVALAGGIRGGRGWWLAGAFVGLGILHKYTAALLPPLMLCAADRDERTGRDPVIGAGIAALVVAPHAAWLAAHDGRTLRFIAHDAVGHGFDLLGPLRHLGGQLLWVTPILAVAGWMWAARAGRRVLNRTGTRAERFAWWTAAPLWLVFAVSALFGEGEVHWAAPAWLSCGIGLAASGQERWQRPVLWGSGLGLLLTCLTFVHGTHPLGRLPRDPGTRLTEGRVLASTVARWALPTGVAAWDAGAQDGQPIWTERYQEAALIAFHTGLPTHVVPGCGRPTVYAEWPPPAPEGFFVRPTRGGPPTCAEDHFGELSSMTTIRGMDAHARLAGRWDVFQVRGAP